MAQANLMPASGSTAWRNAMIERFHANATRCRSDARKMTDREEQQYAHNLARLWEQLAEAAEFQRSFSR